MIFRKFFMGARFYKNKKDGYVTLAGVLVLGVVGAAIILNLITSGMEASQSSFALMQSSKAENLANACIETALKRIEGETNFAGGEALIIDSGRCQYDVVKGSGESRIINAYGITGDITRKKKVEINKISPAINIVYWRDVVNF